MQLKNNVNIDSLSEPLVSICCMTYNHENYIRQCLDGFVMQQTTFPIEILVHDDASTDNTSVIVKEFEAKHPHLFRCVYQTENQFAKQNAFVNIILSMSRGKYIALCDGDDYWIDPYKLQKQVDFLEANENYAGCSHNTRIIYEDGAKDDALIVTSAIKDTYTIDDITKGQIYFHSTSMVYRNVFKGNFPKKYLTDYMGDWFLQMAYADIGHIKYIDSVMSVYRIHTDGVWSKLSDIEQIEKNLNAIIVFNKVFEYKYEENFLSLFTRGFLNICKDKDYKFYEKFYINMASPDLSKIIFYAYKDIIEKDNTILEKDNIIRNLENNLNSKIEEISRTNSTRSSAEMSPPHELEDVINPVQSSLQIRKIEHLQTNGNDIVARLRATRLGRFYFNHLKQHAFVHWITRWIWRKSYPIYVKHIASHLLKTR